MVKAKRSKKVQRKQGKQFRRQTRKDKRRRVSETRSPRIGPNTPHDVCSERMTAFGGLLALVKFLDLIMFKDVFEKLYVSPPRRTESDRPAGGRRGGGVTVGVGVTGSTRYSTTM